MKLGQNKDLLKSKNKNWKVSLMASPLHFGVAVHCFVDPAKVFLPIVVSFVVQWRDKTTDHSPLVLL